MSKKKNVIAHVGSFEITSESHPGHDYIRIKTIDGHWGIMHRDDSPMYGVWMAMCKDPEYKKGLEVRCVMEYHMSNALYDEDFIKEWWDSYGAMLNRRNGAMPEPTPEEEELAADEALLIEESRKYHQ